MEIRCETAFLIDSRGLHPSRDWCPPGG